MAVKVVVGLKISVKKIIPTRIWAIAPEKAPDNKLLELLSGNLFSELSVFGSSDALKNIRPKDLPDAVFVAFDSTRRGNYIHLNAKQNKQRLREAVDAAHTSGVKTVISLENLPKVNLGSNFEHVKPKAEFPKGPLGPRVITVKTAPIYCEKRQGLRSAFQHLRHAFKPAVSMARLADIIDTALGPTCSPVLYATDDQHQNWAYQYGRKALNAGFAIGFGLVTAPIVLLSWLAIKAESKGAGFFLQKRVGQDQKTFTVIKLRTMLQGTPQVDSHAVGTIAITRIGALLRSRKIDEFPQVYNILRGELSVVGPRPCMTNLTDVISLRKAHGVFDIPQGLTGLAQILHLDTSVPNAMVDAERLYVHARSLTLDIRIILATAFGQGFGDKAVKNGAKLASKA